MVEEKKGFTGEVVTDMHPISFITDATTIDESTYSIVGFIDDEESIRWSSEYNMEQRKQKVVEILVEFFGPDAKNPISYFDHEWKKEPTIRGCVNGTRVNVLSKYGMIHRNSIHNLHFAGTETARIWW